MKELSRFDIDVDGTHFDCADGEYCDADEAMAALESAEAENAALRARVEDMEREWALDKVALQAELDQYTDRVAELEAMVPKPCDGKEQDAFELWAAENNYLMTQHPLHYLFLDAKTSAARDGWRSALGYVEKTVFQPPEVNSD